MITGSVQINKGYYFLVFNMYNEYGKRKPEWHSTGLKVDINERKNNQNKKQAEKMLKEELVRINAENSFSNKINSIAKNSRFRITTYSWNYLWSKKRRNFRLNLECNRLQ